MDTPISRSTQHRRQRKLVLLGLVLCSALAGSAWGIQRLLEPTLRLDEIRVAQVHPGAIANTINASGVVIPTHEEQITSPLPSRISKVFAKPGQNVAAGELLLQLDDQSIVLAIDNLKEQIAQQENRIAGLAQELQHTLKQRASEIELSELDLQGAKIKLARYQKAGSLGLTTAVDLQAAELAVKRGEILLRQQRETMLDARSSTQTHIEAARLQKSILQKQLEQQQRLQAQTRVRAPFAGTLSWLLADEGASVAGGQMLAKVSESHHYRVEASVSDFYARYLAPGQAVRIESAGQTLDGKVHTVLPEIQGGTVKLLISLNQSDNPQLRDKLRVEAKIVTEQKADTLVFDTGPAINGRGRQDVYLLSLDGKQASKQVLEIGISDGKAAEIVGGAKAGARLIVSDTTRFKHLDRIAIR
jgi:HlyD family secretion protein